ncbi:MAG: methylenetetrahydrofolate reductase [Nitriliruptoraceae bacterium]
MTMTPLLSSLERARFEIIPMKGVEEQIDHLPDQAVVTVTASPTKGLSATLELAATLAGKGHRVVPHLSARLVRSRDHLEEILEHLQWLGIVEAFVPAGDIEEPLGPYEGAADLLEAMAQCGHHLEHIGITGYPERHAFIPDQTTIEAMDRKAPHATHIVSQICYDPATIRNWIAQVRTRGVHLPVFLGIPGVIDRARLLRVSMRVGLGDSVRFLRKQHDVATRMLAGYQPDELLYALADLIDHPDQQVAGWHLFTFNEVARTEEWRQQLMASLRAA